MFVLFVMRSYLIEVRGLKRSKQLYKFSHRHVVSYRGTWVKTFCETFPSGIQKSYLIEVRGLKH